MLKSGAFICTTFTGDVICFYCFFMLWLVFLAVVVLVLVLVLFFFTAVFSGLAATFLVACMEGLLHWRDCIERNRCHPLFCHPAGQMPWHPGMAVIVPISWHWHALAEPGFNRASRLPFQCPCCANNGFISPAPSLPWAVPHVQASCQPTNLFTVSLLWTHSICTAIHF